MAKRSRGFGKRKDAKAFSATASKTKAINVGVTYRGGVRL